MKTPPAIAREHLTEAAEALAPVVPCVLALRTLKANGWLFISHMSTSVGGVPAVTVFALP